MSAGGSMLDEAPSEQVTPMERLYDLEERFFVLDPANIAQSDIEAPPRCAHLIT